MEFDPGHKDNHWHLDKRFTVGNLLTSIVIVGAVTTWVYKLDERITRVEENIAFQQKLIDILENRRDQQYAEIRDTLIRIERKLDSKADK